MMMNRLDEAKARAQAGLAIIENALSQHHVLVASTTSTLGEIQRRLGEYDVSRVALRRAADIYQRSAPDHAFLFEIRLSLARLARDTGADVEADSLFRTFVQASVQNSPTHAIALEEYAAFLNARGRAREAASVQARLESIRTADTAHAAPH
jgi:ATP/maltotriose-dependent transcriptional regulator MalT